MNPAFLFIGALFCACAIWFMSPYVSWDGSAASAFVPSISNAKSLWQGNLMVFLFSPVVIISLTITMCGLLMTAGVGLYKKHRSL